jgi:hypothetical protein
VRSKGGLAAVLVLVIAALAATPASAASTRPEYVSQAEGICAAPSQQLASVIRQLNKVQKAAPKLRPSQAARRLGKVTSRFAQIELNILTQLGTLVPAPGDEATAAQWLQGERNANALVFRAARIGKHGNLRGFIRTLGRSISVASQANQIVAGWGFQACVF